MRENSFATSHQVKHTLKEVDVSLSKSTNIQKSMKKTYIKILWCVCFRKTFYSYSLKCSGWGLFSAVKKYILDVSEYAPTFTYIDISMGWTHMKSIAVTTQPESQ